LKPFHFHSQSQRHSAAQVCKELASFARSRLGIDPLHSSRVLPFFFRVNAPLVGGWLGGSDQEKSDVTHPVAPAQKTAQQVESLRKALQMRKGATDKIATGAWQPVLFTPQQQPALHPELLQVQPGQALVRQPQPKSSTGIKNAPALAMQEISPAVTKLARADHVEMRVVLPPVKWMRDEDAPRCCECNAAFTMFNRRHHCRVCGRIVDKRCCSNFYIDQSMQLVCLPCQRDIEHGQTPAQAAQNRVQPEHTALQNAEAANQFGFALEKTGLLHSTEVHLRPEHSHVPEHLSAVSNSGPSSRKTRDRRFAVTAPAPPVVSPAMQLSDLRHNEPQTLSFEAVQHEMYPPSIDLPIYNTQPFHSPHVPSSSKRQRLPSRALGSNNQPLAIHTSSTSRDPFEAAYALLDNIYQDCSNPDLAGLAVEQLDFATFVQWAESSLEVPTEAAAIAAVAAYQLTQNLVRSSLHETETHEAVKSPGIAVPRSLFPMLLLNFKLELQKHEISCQASTFSSGRLVKGNLPRKVQGHISMRAAASTLELQSGSHDASPYMGKKTSQKGLRAEGTTQFDAAVREIESVLQSSGIGSEDCQKVAADLVNAGASDKRTLVLLLQQDNSMLSLAGLQPSHVLKVLRHMVKQPAFAAEAPSFRLNLDDD